MSNWQSGFTSQFRMRGAEQDARHLKHALTSRTTFCSHWGNILRHAYACCNRSITWEHLPLTSATSCHTLRVIIIDTQMYHIFLPSRRIIASIVLKIFICTQMQAAVVIAVEHNIIHHYLLRASFKNKLHRAPEGLENHRNHFCCTEWQTQRTLVALTFLSAPMNVINSHHFTEAASQRIKQNCVRPTYVTRKRSAVTKITPPLVRPLETHATNA